MSEYNSLDNSISGKPKGKNFFVGGKDAFKKDPSVKIEIDGMINKDLTNDLIIQREKREIKEYNQSLRTIDPRVENVVLNGNNLLIRLFKHNPHFNTGLIQEKRPIMVRFQDSQSGKTKTEDAYLQYIHRGIIVNMTGKYSDNFADKFHVGDVVDVKSGLSLEQQICFLDVQEFYHKGLYAFDNYFQFNENMIDKKILNYEF
jgi:hypothetical protein